MPLTLTHLDVFDIFTFCAFDIDRSNTHYATGVSRLSQFHYTDQLSKKSDFLLTKRNFDPHISVREELVSCGIIPLIPNS